MDELLYSPNMQQYLDFFKEYDVSLPMVEGYDMYHDVFPEDYGQLVINQVKTGIRNPAFNKQIIFDPKRIHEINYLPGAHSCNPKGKLLTHARMPLKLLHYKYLGFDYLTERHRMYAKRLSDFNKKKRYGSEYTQSHSLVDWFPVALKQTVKVI